jgi:hypothetical protein
MQGLFIVLQGWTESKEAIIQGSAAAAASSTSSITPRKGIGRTTINRIKVSQ